MEDRGSIKSPNSQEVQTSKRKRSDSEMDRYWYSIVVQGLLSSEIKGRVRKNLEKGWHIYRVDVFRDIILRNWGPSGILKATLDDNCGKVTDANLYQFCNKATALYSLQTSQSLDAYGERSREQRVIFAAMFREWFAYYGGQPDFEFWHYLANAVQVTSKGPSTLYGILQAHRNMCAQASELANKAKQNKSSSPWAGLRDRLYNILPLYKALIMVLDREAKPVYERHIYEDPDGWINLHKVAQCETVLLIRTGNEDGLSGPISFAGLRDKSYSLERSDANDRMLPEVIRVSIATASQFIVDLEEREKLHLSNGSQGPELDPRLHPTVPKAADMRKKGNGFLWPPDPPIFDNPKEYAEACIKVAEVHGYDALTSTRIAIRQVLAESQGESYLRLPHKPFGTKWKE